MKASKADLEWSARIDQALIEYPEMQEYLDGIRGNIEALASRLDSVREMHSGTFTEFNEWMGEEVEVCTGCHHLHPCPTLREIEGEE